MTTTDLPEVAIRLGVAALGGLAVGIEREWTMRRGRHVPHFAGVRTFLLLGLLGALGAELARTGPIAAGTALLAAGAALIVIAYALTSRHRDVGGTTEVAALIVLAAGALAGTGQLALASGLFAATTLVLVQKGQLHRFVSRIRSQELLAATRFAVLALVIFPLLPLGPFGPAPGLRPRELWALVLLFSGVSFVSYLALRLVGPARGYGLTGLLGGLVSSTAVTLHFARDSRHHRHVHRLLAAGAIGACTILPLRVLVLLGVLNPGVGALALPLLVPPLAVGCLATVWCLRGGESARTQLPPTGNPLRFGPALQMALAFQVVLYIMDWVHLRFGSLGMLASAAVVGLTDLDALTFSTVRMGGSDDVLRIAARALAVGVLSNTGFKLGIALVIGRGDFRRIVSVGLIALALASFAALVWL